MDASIQTTTLRQVLTQPKPAIPPESGRVPQARNGRWPKIAAGPTPIWEDFNIAVLNESYGFILDRPAPAQLFASSSRPDQALDGITLTNTASARMLSVWADGQVLASLRYTKDALGLCRDAVLRSKARGPADPSVLGNIAADYSIKLEGGGPERCLLIGLVKLSRGWNSSIATGSQSRDSRGSRDVWELRQLAEACTDVNTRYGFILTDRELVACLFTEDGGDADCWHVAIMPVPWVASGPHMLTVELALWWLCMLAMSGDSAIVGKDEMIRINSWESLFLGNERGWERRHLYSGHQEPTTSSQAAAGFDWLHDPSEPGNVPGNPREPDSDQSNANGQGVNFSFFFN